MKKIVFSSIFLFSGIFTNAQQLLEVLQPSLNVAFGGGEKMLLSVYDNNYRHYQTPTSPADWETEAEGTDHLVDYQGQITESGLLIRIPITVSGQGASTTISAYTSSPITIPAEKTQDGQSRQIVVSWDEHTNITKQSQYITARIKTLSGVLNIKKLDINRGVGNDSRGVLLADILYPTHPTTKGNTETSTYAVRVIAGIPDRKYNVPTNGEYKHQFIYMPLPLKRESQNGIYNKIWLNYNLGADYTDMNGDSFNPIKKAHYTDEKTYGSYYQWQRPSDGHEKKDAAARMGFYDKSDWAPGHNVVLYGNNASPYSWVPSETNLSPENKDLWQAGGTNNPCPTGFHVPTFKEWDSINFLYKGNGLPVNEHIDMRTILPLAGYRGGILRNVGSEGNYWSSTISNGISSIGQSEVFQVYNNGGSSPSNYAGRALGLPIRCIED